MKLLLTLLLVLTFACKPLQKSETQNYQSIADYQLNPDEVLVEVNWKSSEEKNGMWMNNVEVVKQVQAGFGFRRILSVGTLISFSTESNVEGSSSFCVFEYQISPDSNNDYIFKTFLKK